MGYRGAVLKRSVNLLIILRAHTSMSIEGSALTTGNRAEGRNETLRNFTERADKNIARLQAEIQELEEGERVASAERRDSGTKVRLSYARAELVAAQEAREILVAAGKPVPLGTSGDHLLYDVRNRWQTINPQHGGLTSAVRFSAEGIDGLSSYFAATNPPAVPERGVAGSVFRTQSPFIANKTTRYLYHQMGVTPVGEPQQQEQKLSSLKRGEKNEWGTDVDGVSIVYERVMVPKTDDPNYEEEVARVRVAVKEPGYAEGSEGK